MDKIVHQKVNKAKKHPTTRKWKTLYLLRWYDDTIDDDTWEPIENLPRSKVLSYHRLKNFQPPDYIDKAVVGWNAPASQKHISKRDSRRVAINSDLGETDPRCRTTFKCVQEFDLLPDRGEFEDFVNERTAKLK